MKSISRFTWIVVLTTMCVACGGDGGGKSQRVQQQPPEPPVVTVDADIKQLIFSWDEVTSATHYRLMENLDGHSGFTQNGGDIPSDTLIVTKEIAVHLHDWVNALYMVQACNTAGCTGSTEVSGMPVMLDTIGYFKSSYPVGGGRGFSNDFFGDEVALSADGRTLAVGAYSEDNSATGVNSTQLGYTSDSGAVYVFRNDGTGWSQQAYVKASNTGEDDSFGSAIDLSADGDTLVVTAKEEGSAATGINGDQTDNSARDAGAAYVFRFDGTDWYQEAYIKASNAEFLDQFGINIALSADGNTMAVGANFEDSSATGINGDQFDNSADHSGAAYVFRFDGVEWFQEAYVKASNTEARDNYGRAVALSGDGTTLAVGATGEGSGATGVNGDESDNSAGSSGAVYLYRFNGAQWVQDSFIKASNTDASDADSFGIAVSLNGNGDTLAVGAFRESSGATGINGDQIDNSANFSGAAYLFRHDGVDWQQQAYIKASNTIGGETFGLDLDLSGNGNMLIVGAYREKSLATGIGGDQNDSTATEAGAAYLFQFDGTDWFQQSYLKASNTELFDKFGLSVAVSGDGNTVAVGSSGEDSNATGINGDQSDNTAPDSGAVYVY